MMREFSFSPAHTWGVIYSPCPAGMFGRRSAQVIDAQIAVAKLLAIDMDVNEEDLSVLAAGCVDRRRLIESVSPKTR